MNHELIEKNAGLMGVLIAAVISVASIVEIVPMLRAHAARAPEGARLLSPIEVAGRDVYIREGCHVCHSQQVRYLAEEVLRYGPPSTAGESAWEHPYLWGSKRTGPDLARVGGRYSDQWHRIHLTDPRAVVPESNMPGYPWLAQRPVDGAQVRAMMGALRTAGVPYSEADLEKAESAVSGLTEMDALIAYLQGRKAPVAPAREGATP